MVAANHNRRFQLATFHHGVKGQPGNVPLAQANPANARWQALKIDALGRHVQPAVQVLVGRKKLFHLGVGFGNVFGVAA